MKVNKVVDQAVVEGAVELRKAFNLPETFDISEGKRVLELLAEKVIRRVREQDKVAQTHLNSPM